MIAILAEVSKKVQFHCNAHAAWSLTSTPEAFLAFVAHQHDKVLAQGLAFDFADQLIERLQLLQGLLLRDQANQEESRAPGNGEALQTRVAVASCGISDVQRHDAVAEAQHLAEGIFDGWQILIARVATHPPLHQRTLAHASGAKPTTRWSLFLPGA